MAYSDARNERDRADTGRNSSNHGGGNARDAADRNRAAMGGGFGSGSRGTLSQQQDRRNAAAAAAVGNRAPGVKGPAPSQYDSRTLNPRYNQNLIASGPMTMHNLQELSKMMPGPGMALRAGLGALGYTGPLGGPAFEGVTNRSATGFSYDGPNRYGTQGMFANPGVQGVQAAGAPKPPTPQQPGMSQMQMPGGQMNVPGPSQYGVNLPSYGYFGQPPAQQRPKSAIMGGI